jgi:hypothetical protein
MQQGKHTFLKRFLSVLFTNNDVDNISSIAEETVIIKSPSSQLTDWEKSIDISEPPFIEEIQVAIVKTAEKPKKLKDFLIEK